MSYTEATFYTARCDLCGAEDAGYEYAAWSDRDGADAAVADDWHVEGGNHLCRDCVPAYDFEDAEADGELEQGHGSPLHACYAAGAVTTEPVEDLYREVMP